MSQANREDSNLPERPGGPEGRLAGRPRADDRTARRPGDGPDLAGDVPGIPANPEIPGVPESVPPGAPADDSHNTSAIASGAAPDQAPGVEGTEGRESRESREGGDGPEDDDPRRDPMAPPEEPCECFCLHCGRTFMSDRMWFQKVKGARDGFPGFWMCPTPNCDGAGFTFDIFPTDPAHPANDGWDYDDGEEGEGGEEGEEGEDLPDEGIPWDDEGEGSAEASQEWDPDESKYKAMDEWDDEDDDLEGEEWKHGLQPGERPKAQAPPPGVEPRSQEEQEALYDEPDRRPRELDWSDRDDRPPRRNADDPNAPGEPYYGEDDIPF